MRQGGRETGRQGCMEEVEDEEEDEEDWWDE